MAQGEPITKYQERQGYIQKANETEAKYNLPHNMLVGVMATESNYNPRAVSRVNAKGLMQFMPETAKEFKIDPYNTDQSIDAAGKYLFQNYKQLGNWDDTLRSYNMGLGGVRQWKAGKKTLPKETAEYVGKVYKNMSLGAVDKSFKQIKEQAPQEVNTKVLTNFDIPINSSNFVSVPDSPKEEEKTEKKEESESLSKLKEDSFLKDYKSLLTQQEVPQIEQQNAPIEKSNLQNIYNQVSNFIDTPIAAQSGGSVKQDDAWAKNWYQNRVIPDERLQELYLEDKPYYEKQLLNIPKVTNVQSIDKNPNITGRYSSKTGKIQLTPKAQFSVYTHELDHYLNDFPSVMRTVHNDIIDNNVYKKGDKRLQNNNKIYDYLKDSEEVHARIQVLRKDAGFKPEEVIDDKKLMNYLQNYKGNDENILQIINMTDKKGLLQMLNYMADNGNNKSTSSVAQNGGEIIKDNNGYLNPKNWGKTVEIQGQNITMKGVNQNLVGYSPETGERKLMTPGNEYVFRGAKRVIETPITQNEIDFLNSLK